MLTLFLEAIDNDGGLWPSRIHVDRGVENVLVCDAMVMARGDGRGSFIPGPSTHDQRIEKKKTIHNLMMTRMILNITVMIPKVHHHWKATML